MLIGNPLFDALFDPLLKRLFNPLFHPLFDPLFYSLFYPLFDQHLPESKPLISGERLVFGRHSFSAANLILSSPSHSQQLILSSPSHPVQSRLHCFFTVSCNLSSSSCFCFRIFLAALLLLRSHLNHCRTYFKPHNRNRNRKLRIV